MNLNQNLTCKYCDRIFRKPVFLACCGEHICKADADALLSKLPTATLFRCPICKASTTNPRFQINQTLQVLIDEAEIHEFKIDPDHLQTLKKFKEKIAYLENLENDPFIIILKQIAQVKKILVTDREEGIAKQTFFSHEKKIEKLNNWEIAFKAETCSKEMLDYFANAKAELKNDLKEYEKCLKSLRFTEAERKKQKKHMTDAMRYLDLEMDIYLHELCELKLISYEKMEALRLFGKKDVSAVYSN